MRGTALMPTPPHTAPRRRSSAKKQRELAQAIKRSRQIGLLPYIVK